jgi:hypothetical protein
MRHGVQRGEMAATPLLIIWESKRNTAGCPGSNFRTAAVKPARMSVTIINKLFALFVVQFLFPLCLGVFVRNFLKKLPLDEAVEAAIKYCIKHDILREFLEKNSTEVVNMFLEEWNLEDELYYTREEGREEGRQEIARNALAEGATVEFVQKITGLPIETIEQIANSK